MFPGAWYRVLVLSQSGITLQGIFHFISIFIDKKILWFELEVGRYVYS